MKITGLKEQLEETRKQLKGAQDNVTMLSQYLNEVNAETTKYHQLPKKQKFCFSNIEESDKDVYFYTGLQCILWAFGLFKPWKNTIQYCLQCYC